MGKLFLGKLKGFINHRPHNCCTSSSICDYTYCLRTKQNQLSLLKSYVLFNTVTGVLLIHLPASQTGIWPLLTMCI